VGDGPPGESADEATDEVVVDSERAPTSTSAIETTAAELLETDIGTPLPPSVA
jgi:hypothetical protein